MLIISMLAMPTSTWMPMLLLIIIMIIGTAVIGIMMIIGVGADGGGIVVLTAAEPTLKQDTRPPALSTPLGCAPKTLELKDLLLYQGEGYRG
jgi:uncharacterized membrane protein YedE/YeeE